MQLHATSMLPCYLYQADSEKQKQNRRIDLPFQEGGIEPKP